MISLDLKRLLDHDEELFGFDHEAVWEVIRTFVLYCDRYASKLDDLQVASDKELAFFRESNPYRIDIAKRHPDTSFEIALTELLRRPRILKYALRRTWLAWKSLHGEVNLDDLLVYSAIRTSSTEAVAFIRDQGHQLTSNADREDKEAIKGLWDAQMRGVSDKECAWLWRMMESMFPSLDRTGGRTKTQGISKERYLPRIVNGRIEGDGFRDQMVIKDVAKWKESKSDSSLIDGLVSDTKYASVFEDLFYNDRPAQIGLNGEDVLCLASQLFEVIRDGFGAQANSDSCPAFITLWRLQNQGRQFKNYEEWLWSEMKKTLPISLLLVNEVEYFWASPNYSPLDGDARDRLKDRMLDWAKEHLDLKELCRLLTDVPVHVLYYFILGSRTPKLTREQRLNSWQWFGPVLLDSLSHRGNVMIPQAVFLFSSGEHRLRDDGFDEQSPYRSQFETVHSLRKDEVAQLFTDLQSRRRFVDLIMQSSTDEEEWPTDTQVMVSQIRAELAVWLKEGLTYDPPPEEPPEGQQS